MSQNEAGTAAALSDGIMNVNRSSANSPIRFERRTDASGDRQDSSRTSDSSSRRPRLSDGIGGESDRRATTRSARDARTRMRADNRASQLRLQADRRLDEDRRRTVADELAGAAEDVAGSVLDPIRDPAGQLASDAVDGIGSFASDVAGSLFGDDAASSVRDTFDGFRDDAVDAVNDGFDSLQERAGDEVRDAIGGLQDDLSESLGFEIDLGGNSRDTRNPRGGARPGRGPFSTNTNAPASNRFGSAGGPRGSGRLDQIDPNGNGGINAEVIALADVLGEGIAGGDINKFAPVTARLANEALANTRPGEGQYAQARDNLRQMAQDMGFTKESLGQRIDQLFESGQINEERYAVNKAKLDELFGEGNARPQTVADNRTQPRGTGGRNGGRPAAPLSAPQVANDRRESPSLTDRLLQDGAESLINAGTDLLVDALRGDDDEDEVLPPNMTPIDGPQPQSFEELVLGPPQDVNMSTLPAGFTFESSNSNWSDSLAS